MSIGPTIADGFRHAWLQLTTTGLTAVPEPTRTADGWRLLTRRRHILPLIVAGGVLAGLSVLLWHLAGALRTDPDLSALVHLLLYGICAILPLFTLYLWWLFLRQLLRERAPVVDLVLDAPHLVRGRPATLRWSFAGARPPRALRFALRLSEECEYHRGTDTYADRRELRILPLAGLAAPAGEGRCTVLVPDDQPPSFTGRAHQLLWVLHVHTAAGLTVAEVPLRVLPGEAAVAGIAVHPLASAASPPAGALLTLAGASGTVRAGGRVVTLRLRWAITGKGDADGAVVATATVPTGEAAFTITLPALPPAHRGTLLTISWLVEALVGDQVIASQEIAAG